MSDSHTHHPRSAIFNFLTPSSTCYLLVENGFVQPSLGLVYQTMPALNGTSIVISIIWLARKDNDSPYAHRATTTHVPGDVTTRIVTYVLLLNTWQRCLGSRDRVSVQPQMPTGAVDPERTCMTLHALDEVYTALLSTQTMSLRLSAGSRTHHICLCGKPV